jgi:hypothetical protein
MYWKQNRKGVDNTSCQPFAPNLDLNPNPEFKGPVKVPACGHSTWLFYQPRLCRSNVPLQATLLRVPSLFHYLNMADLELCPLEAIRIYHPNLQVRHPGRTSSKVPCPVHAVNQLFRRRA